MPCLVGIFALAFPRIALFLVWFLGGNYLDRAYPHWIAPVVGFFFLPLTTLVFAFAHNALGSGETLSSFGWLLVVIAVVVDLGLWSGGGRHAQRWGRERWRRP